MLIIGNFIYPQSTYNETYVPFLAQGFGLPLLNSSGTSGLSNHISNMSFINPAALGQFRSYSIGVSYQFQTNLDEVYVAGIGSSRITDFSPQTAGVAVPIGNMHFGLAMGQTYNGTLDFGPIPITTVQNPGGTGEFFTPEYETRVQSYSFLFSYSFENILSANNNLSFGLKYTLNRLNYYNKISIIIIDESDNSSSWGIGASYQINFAEEQNVQFGLNYESKIEFRKNYTIQDNIIDIDPTDSTRNFILANQSFSLLGEIPDKLRFDIKFSVIPKLLLFSSLNYVFWNNASSNFNDQLEFGASAVYSISEYFSPSLGFYYTDKNFEEDFFDINSEMDAFFIIAGLNADFNLIDVDFAIADSHLLSGEFRKQTIIKFTLGFHL
jgi:hypothetical protein